MVEHIETHRLHGDLRYRYDYLCKFLNFTSQDILMLNNLAPILFPRIPVIVDTVYRKLFSFDVTKQSFLVHQQGFDNIASDTNVDTCLQSIQMTFRRDMLSMYLRRVLSQAEWNDTFLQYLSRIGEIHSNRSETGPAINVDYIHINALLGYLQHLLIEILWKLENINDKSKLGMMMALNKFFWIQSDFFTMHFIPNDNGKSSPAKTIDKKSDGSSPCCPCLLN